MRRRMQVKPHFRVDLHLHENPKMVPLAPPAFKLYFLAMSWCASLRTDGLIPKVQLETFVRGHELGEFAIRDLEKGNFLSNGEKEGVFQVHDYLDWNDSRKYIEAVVRKKQRAGRKGGKQKASKALAGARQVP